MSVCSGCGFPFDDNHPEVHCNPLPPVRLEIGKTYYMANGNKTKITEAVGDDELAAQAGYAFRSERGRNYTAWGDHNDPDLVIVEECLLGK